jgi:uncharacterized protein
MDARFRGQKCVKGRSDVGRGLSRPIRKLLSELNTELAALYEDRLRALIVFGSYARGDARWDSDLDVAMVLDGFDHPFIEIERTGQITSDLSLKYDLTVSLIPVRERDLSGERTLLASALRREGVPVA